MVKKAKPKSKKTAGKHPGGAPTKYKDAFVKIAYQVCCELGASDIGLAKVFDVSKSTITNWKKEHPEFLASIKSGKDVYDSQIVEASLLKRAKGFRYIEITREPSKVADAKTGKGKLRVTKKVSKFIAPDTTALIFWLKNRQPERWRDKQFHDLNFNAETLNAILAGLPEEFADGVRKALGQLISSKRN